MNNMMMNSPINGIMNNPISNGMPSAMVTSSIATSIPLLMNNLPNMMNNAGITPTTINNTSTVTTNVEEKEENEKDSEKEEERPKSKYKKFSEFPSISLTNDAIHKPHPEFIESIYEFLSYQCKQCGRRYYKNEEETDNDSEEKILSHLDWHFRQNRRLKNKSKQTLCRGWQDISEDDWINSKTVEGKFTTPTFFQFDTTNTENEDSENNEKEKETIKYLPCDDGTPKKCFVCNEDFEKHWHEDEEEWMFKNAIEKEGKVFHPSCYSDYISRKKLKSKIMEAAKEDSDNEKAKSETASNESENSPKKEVSSPTKEKRKLEDESGDENDTTKKLKMN